jgi:hypothetical protein
VTLVLDDDVQAALDSAMRAVLTVPAFPLDGSVKTLGFEALDWIEAKLLQPDGDEAGEAFLLTPEQINFVLWLYALDEAGRFVYRRAVLRRAKGWGKSPFLGAIALLELCGPVRFGGWDAAGEPVAVPHSFPWVVVAGVSEMQTENTLAAIRAMSETSSLPDDYGLDVGMTRLLLPGGGKLHAITANAATQEGARPSFAIMDETHHWTKGNGGKGLARVIRRNLAKSRDGSARSIETTNAHEPGQDSVAEDSYNAWRAIVEKRSRSAGLLYDSREGAESVDLSDEAQVRRALAATYGDATWVDLDRILGEVYDPDTPPEEARRFYLNQIVAAADSWTTSPAWHANRQDEIPPLKFAEPGRWKHGADAVVLGFDGSLTDDSTALVAVRMDDGSPWLLAVWERPEGPAGDGWEVPKDQVRDAVDYAFSTLDVVAFHSDVAYWETDVDHWRDTYSERLLIKATTRHAVAWDMRGNQADGTRAAENLWRSIADGEIPWRAHTLLAGTNRNGDGHEVLTRHVVNARRRPNRYGVSFGKESRESPKKIDALAALLLARIARTRVLADPAWRKRRARSGRLMGF